MRRHLKHLMRHCVRCQKVYAQPSSQQMGDLPTYRTTPALPFSRTGIDFAGPFLINRGNPRKPTRIKVYAALFICLCTKAVHINLCADLSTEAFLTCLSRFVSRRSCPSDIFSDNGTNFVRANLELGRLAKSSSDSRAIWYFIPPRTPHFSGLWEANVKSMKRLLAKQVGSIPLRYDELETVLINIEALLNSRPEPVTSTDPDAIQPLIPGHFFIERPLKALTTKDLSGQYLLQAVESGPETNGSIVDQLDRNLPTKSMRSTAAGNIRPVVRRLESSTD